MTLLSETLFEINLLPDLSVLSQLNNNNMRSSKREIFSRFLILKYIWPEALLRLSIFFPPLFWKKTAAAMAQLQRSRNLTYSRIPDLLKGQGNLTGPSRGSWILSNHQIRPWAGFLQAARNYTNGLLGQIPAGLAAMPVDREVYVVANEDGVKARFIENVCGAVGKVCAFQGVNVRFADIQAAKSPPNPCEKPYPDTSIQTVDGEPRAVAEIKTPWITDLGKD